MHSTISRNRSSLIEPNLRASHLSRRRRHIWADCPAVCQHGRRSLQPHTIKQRPRSTVDFSTPDESNTRAASAAKRWPRRRRPLPSIQRRPAPASSPKYSRSHYKRQPHQLRRLRQIKFIVGRGFHLAVGGSHSLPHHELQHQAAASAKLHTKLRRQVELRLGHFGLQTST